MRWRYRSECGFTLLEVVVVIVVLGVLALGTTQFIVQGTRQYTVSAQRTSLIAGGRIAVEKIGRRLRNALPNSVLVSQPLGRCVEYIPVVAGASSLGAIPQPATSLSVADFDLPGSAPYFAAIYPIASAEIYVGTPGATGVLATSGLAPGAGISSIALSNPGGYSYTRTSPTERVYVVQGPERFCITAAGTLDFYSGYAIPDYTSTTLGDAPAAAVAATAALVARDLDTAGSGFSYAPGSPVRNAIVSVTINLLKDDDPVRINHEVQIRNVP